MKFPDLRSLRAAFRTRNRTGASPVRDWGILLGSTATLFLGCVVFGSLAYFESMVPAEDRLIQGTVVDIPDKDDVSSLIEVLHTRRARVEERANSAASIILRNSQPDAVEEPAFSMREFATSSTSSPAVAE